MLQILQIKFSIIFDAISDPVILTQIKNSFQRKVSWRDHLFYHFEQNKFDPVLNTRKYMEKAGQVT